MIEASVTPDYISNFSCLIAYIPHNFVTSFLKRVTGEPPLTLKHLLHCYRHPQSSSPALGFVALIQGPEQERVKKTMQLCASDLPTDHQTRAHIVLNRHGFLDLCTCHTDNYNVSDYHFYKHSKLFFFSSKKFQNGSIV